MSVWNVHANWFPVDGTVKFVNTSMEIIIKHGYQRQVKKTNMPISSLQLLMEEMFYVDR